MRRSRPIPILPLTMMSLNEGVGSYTFQPLGRIKLKLRDAR